MPELPYNLQHINKRLKTLIMKHIFGKLQNVIIFPIREGSSIKVMSVIKEYQNSTHIVHNFSRMNAYHLYLRQKCLEGILE